MTPFVSVAVCTYNRANFLRQTLEGVVRQTYPSMEILVIDNRSTDATAEAVQGFAQARIRPRHVVEPQQGLDYARNRAIAEAKGDIVVFADDDILVKPDWIAQLAAVFSDDPQEKIGAVGGEVIPVFPDGLPPWVAEWHAPLAFRTSPGPLGPKDSPMGANLAIRKSVFSRLGTFHTGLDRTGGSYFSGGDSEMIRRIRAAGLEVWFVPAASVRHQMPESRTTFSYAARHAFDSARSRVLDRAGQPGAVRYFVSRLIVNAVKAAALAISAVLWILIFRKGHAKKALVRAWRSCGYLYQIPRSLAGKI